MRNKIYILHGWAYSTEKWEPFIKELKNNKIEAVMLKIPGLTAPLSKVWDIDNYVEWLAESIKDQKSKIILLGHSNGGRIALSFAVKYPEKIKQLILIDSAGIYHNELSIRIKRLVFGSIAKIGKSLASSDSMRKLLYKFAREQDYEKANQVVRQTMRNLIKVDHSKILHTIRIATLMIWGQNDKITPVTDASIIHKEIKNSVLYIIQDARHSPMFTHPMEVLEIIIKNL